MKALIQRVQSAKVDVEGRAVSAIGKGILVLLGVLRGDSEEDMDYIVRKVSNLRLFEDDQGKMNLSVMDINGDVLVVSQFTLASDTRKGNRPSFTGAEDPVKAEKMYLEFMKKIESAGIRVASGEFGSHMAVYLINDGPVTIMIDSRER